MMDAALYTLPAKIVSVAILLGICSAAFVPRVSVWCGSLPRRQVLGIMLVLLVVVLWTASSVAIQLIFEAAHYRKPFFITYFSSAMLMVYLPFYSQRLCRLFNACLGRRTSPYELVREGGATTIPGDESLRKAPMSPLDELSIAVRLGALYFAYQICFIIGLELSTVSTVTIISASSGLWTLLFSWLRLGERVGPAKLLATLLSFSGVMFVMRYGSPRHFGRLLSLGGGMHGANPAWGNGVTMVSAMLYGGYAAQLKREVPDETRLPMPYLFGLFGLMSTVFFAPCIPLLHVLHIERFWVPSTTTVLGLLANALLGAVLSNMLLARAMLLASPLIASVGLSLSIPLALASDLLRGRGSCCSTGMQLGTAAVWIGFIGVSMADWLEERCKRMLPAHR